jgi:hypothetical protein
MVLNNRLLIRRITTVRSIRNNKNEVIGYKATCNHDIPPATKIYPISQWGEIAFQLAREWALDHKCNGDPEIVGTQDGSINLTV